MGKILDVTMKDSSDTRLKARYIWNPLLGNVCVTMKDSRDTRLKVSEYVRIRTVDGMLQ